MSGTWGRIRRWSESHWQDLSSDKASRGDSGSQSGRQDHPNIPVADSTDRQDHKMGSDIRLILAAVRTVPQGVVFLLGIEAKAERREAD